MRIVIVGGGIGGLALAAGLQRYGFEAVVLENDTDLSATGGYHITLDGRAQTALRRLVPPAIHERLLASASALRFRDRDAFWDHRGRLLGHGPDLGTDPSVDVDRITLRLLLAEAAGDTLRTGVTVTGLGPDVGGLPTVLLSDGTNETGDLVVGADGARSIVARSLAGGPTNRPAGIIGFSGRTSSGDLSAGERARLGPRSSMAMGPHGAALYVGFLDPAGNAVLRAPELRSSVTTGPTYIWGAMLPETAQTAGLRRLGGTELRDALLDRFTRNGWRPDTLEVVARTDPGGLGAFRFNAASTSARELAPWPAGTVTALGDAVHATPPTAGMGAGAAVRDAADLVDRLRTVRGGDTALRVAISDYEADLRLRGAEVLTLAMKTVRWILATDTRFGAAATGAVLPALAALHRLRRAG
jgi:salicylate hydroxylase